MARTKVRKWLAELFGTFTLVFTGTGAIVVNEISGGTVTHVGIALTFGLVVLALIYSLGEVSGCHLNPAVTLGFLASGRLAWQSVFPYLVAQILGATLASLALHWMFPENLGLGATLPAGPSLQSFFLELILTLFLMFVILSVSTGSKEKGLMAGVAVGAVIALEALLGGPISGASMNPARSFGPALVTGNFHHLWLYLTAPILGAGVAVIFCKLIHPKDCCSNGVVEE